MDLRLADVGTGRKGIWGREPGAEKAAVLVSFVFLPIWQRRRQPGAIRDWVLDSGAYTAHTQGRVIDLLEYTEKAKQLLAEDPELTEVFALDVIGDHKASRRNAERMWELGVPAIPTFHEGSPLDEAVSLAKEYPKIAYGGVAGRAGAQKEPAADQVFGRIWRDFGPMRIHGFGFAGERQLMRYPFISVDATNWELDPGRFGRWKSYGYGKAQKKGMRIRAPRDLRIEVDWYLALEKRVRARWRKVHREIQEANAERPWPIREV